MAAQQDKATVSFCVRPPSCLNLVGEETQDSDKIFAEEARELQGRLRGQLSQFRTEFGLFARLMYKNKNQHRRCLYYRRLTQVRRDFEILNRSGLKLTVEKLTKSFAINGPAVVGRPKSQSMFQPVVEMDAGKSLSTLLGVARLLNQIDEPIIAASAEIAGLLGQTFFMPFGLTIFSCLARFRALLMQILYEVISAFNLLSTVWHKNHKESMRVLDQLFPSQLECHWKGNRLCMIENSTANTPEEKEGRNNEEQGPPLWAVDDRTGVQYDIGHPGANAEQAADGQPLQAQDTSNVGGTSSMAQEHDRDGIITDSKDALECLSDSIRDHIETGLSSANVWPLNKGSDKDTANEGVRNLIATTSFMAPVPSSGVDDKASLELADGVEIRAKTVLTSESHTRDAGASQKKVAYISVGHKFGLVPNFLKIHSLESLDKSEKSKDHDEIATEEQHRVADSAGAGGPSGFLSEKCCTSFTRSETIQSEKITNVDAWVLDHTFKSCSEILTTLPGEVHMKRIHEDENVSAANENSPVDGLPPSLASSSPVGETRVEQFRSPSSKDLECIANKKKGSKRRRSNKDKASVNKKQLKDEGNAIRGTSRDNSDARSSAGDKDNKRKATNDLFAMLLGGLD